MKDVPVPGAADALRRQAVGRCSRGSEEAMPFFTHGARITDLGHFSARLREQYFIRFLTARGSYEEPNDQMHPGTTIEPCASRVEEGCGFW